MTTAPTRTLRIDAKPVERITTPDCSTEDFIMWTLLFAVAIFGGTY